MRWRPRSLLGRMLVVSIGAALLVLLLAGWVMTSVLERVVVEGLDRRLDAEIALLASTVSGDGRVDRTLLEPRIKALESGPGWRWRIAGPDGDIGSADFPDLTPPHAQGRAADRENRLHPLDGPDEDGVRLHGRQLEIQSRRGPVVLTAAAPRDVVRRPILAAVTPLLAVVLALALILGTASAVQLRLGFRPLHRLRDQVAGIRGGSRVRIDEDQPNELRPLVEELNALTTENEAALKTARQSAANLAHALKTPVATLALDLRDEPARAAQVARIEATIRHHLSRARAHAVDRRASTLIAAALADLVAAVRGLHNRCGLLIDVEAESDVSVAVDSQDFDELVGNLLDNAARHARSRVLIRATREPGDSRLVCITVSDDGGGVSAADRSWIAEAGTRLDERYGGHGFGLSIVTELAMLYGGRLELDGALEGGLRATLLLPATTITH